MNDDVALQLCYKATAYEQCHYQLKQCVDYMLCLTLVKVAEKSNMQV